MDIDKKENFVRIAEKRTAKIIDDLIQLGSMSTKTYYEYSDDQITAIFSAIEEEAHRQKVRLLERGKKFTLR